MTEPTHIRVLALVFAGVMLFGGWYLIESSSQPSTPAPPVRQAPMPTALPPVPQVVQTPPIPVVIPNNLHITYKCEKVGRTSFSDQPCAPGEKTLAVTTSERNGQPANGGNLARMKQQAAQMEADRLAREQRFAAVKQAVPKDFAGIEKMSRCPQIDREIARKDSELRQPHGPGEGDTLTEQRRHLMDERFALRC